MVKDSELIPDVTELLWAEVLCIFIILILLIASHFGDWNRKWIDYRFLAERLRAAIFLCTAGIKCEPPKAPQYHGLYRRYDDWIINEFMEIWGKIPQMQPMTFKDLKKFILEAWINHQIDYYEGASKSNRNKHRLFSWVGTSLFALTFFVAIIDAAQAGGI